MASPNNIWWTSSPVKAPETPTVTNIAVWAPGVTPIVTASPSLWPTSRWAVQPAPTTYFTAPAVPLPNPTGKADGHIDEAGKWGLGSWIVIFFGLLGVGIFGAIIFICYRWKQMKKSALHAPINLWDLVRGKQARPQKTIKVQQLARA